MHRITLIFVFALTIFPSCIYKPTTKTVVSLSGTPIALCIEMPENKLVFENISPLVYDALWSHFNRVGFQLTDTTDHCYSLKVTIKRVESPYKFLSPDLLSYAVKMKIELLCQLFDKEKKMCAQKLFSFSTLVSKAKDYVVNSNFIDFEYRRLLAREVHRIDHHFRPFLLRAGT